ncbi:hypothetical protein [Paenibacillus planticolens]|uniref:hypothetical protein n=1 Tax=Paenibacillus planticolens TaxID=2654976 RepID=UPI0014917B18|nr:hypothetical protein [Paenibacillus planticolens]
MKVKNSVVVFDDSKMQALSNKVNEWLHSTGMDKDIHSVDFIANDHHRYAYIWYSEKI